MHNKKMRYVFASFLAAGLLGCGPKSVDNSTATKWKTPTPTTVPGPTETHFEPLAWEKVKIGSKIWSDHIHKVISEQTSHLLAGAEDIEDFCPRYNDLTTGQRINVWGMLISAIAKFESKFETTARLREESMGTDPVTGRQVYSEGLLQLSYQDTLTYKFCDFDWDSDKRLSPTDPQKTIFDPFRNLSCGTKILDQQIKKYNKIVISRGVYWAVLKEDGKFNQVDNIQKITRSLKFCSN